MATDLEKLVVSLEATTTKYQKAMDKALGITNATARKIESRFDKINLGKDLFAGFARGALSAVGPVLSVAAAIHGAKEALKEFGDIADNAKASGLDAEFFQGLAYQAQLGGVEIEALAGAMATFAKNSGLAVEGRGKMVTALKSLDLGLLENIRNATSQEQRVKLVADALEKTTDASRRAAIATAAFGDAGLKLAGVFAGGADEIDAMQAKARQLGLVVDRDLIARADELGDEFDTTTKIVDLQLKQALVNLGPVLVWLAGLAANVGEQIGRTVDGLNSIQNQSSATLRGRLEGIQTQLDSADPMKSPNVGQVAGIDPAAAKAEQAAILQELTNRYAKKLAADRASANAPATSALPTLEETEAATKSQNAAASAAVAHAKAVKDLIADLQFEGQTIGVTGAQLEIMNNLHRAGVDAASQEGIAIAALTQTNYDHKQSLDEIGKAYDQVKDIAKDALSTFIGDLREGKSATDALADSLNKVGDKLLDIGLSMALDAIFPGAGSVGGGLFSGLFRSSGGDVAAGEAYNVGENGQEKFIPRVPGRIVPNKGGGETIHVVLQDDSGRMAGIADQRIRTASGTLVQVSVATANRTAPGALASYQQQRAGGDYRV